VVVPEAARLDGAAASSWDVVPPLGKLGVRPTGQRVDVQHRAAGPEPAEIDALAGHAAQPEAGSGLPEQMVGSTVVLGHGQIGGKGAQIGHAPEDRLLR